MAPLKQKGDLAELKIAADLIDRGCRLSIPFGEDCDYDLIADYDPDTGHEDVLEDTPEFLEESPEDDELWFEQRPPKDFDFDD